MLPLIILLVTCVVNIALAFLVASRNKQEGTKRVSLVFVTSIFSLVAWSISNYLADTSTILTSALFWTKATFPAALCMGWSIVYFSCIFPVERKKHQIIAVLYGVLVVIFSFLSMGTSIVKEISITEGIGVSNVVVGNMYYFIACIYLMLIIHSTYNFVTSYRNLYGKQKSQIKYVLIGWSTFLSVAFITSNLLPLITGNVSWSKFGPMGSIIMSLSIAYAIVRYEFLEIKIILQKGLIYSTLLFFIVATYLGILYVLEFTLNKSVNISILVSSFITTIAGIFGVPPLKSYFQKITDPIFFKGSYNYASVLGELTNILNQNTTLEPMIKKTSNVIKNSLKAEFVHFTIPGKHRKKETPLLSIEIKSNKKNLGTLELGPKRSGDNYTTTDINLLETFTKQAGVAFEKAYLFNQVKEYAKNLEKKVGERTKELSQIQKEKEALMLEISHGLQTPLTIMKGELFLLHKQGYDTSTVDTLDASIDRISSFIYKLLSLSKIESEHAATKRTMNLTESLEGIVDFFISTAEQKGITLRANLERDIIIQGNKDELDEMFSNIISNAIKYMSKEGKKEVVVSLSKSKKQVTVKIKDSGIGMNQEDQKQLFQKFYRIKNESTKGIKGTGLGLAIAKKVVELHNGTITVESEEGVGTTFTISIPIA